MVAGLMRKDDDSWAFEGWLLDAGKVGERDRVLLLQKSIILEDAIRLKTGPRISHEIVHCRQAVTGSATIILSILACRPFSSKSLEQEEYNCKKLV